ncbi:MAG: hypothetical protein J6J17_01910 [Bacilli bacterium]|nr:hypothetical protein [Bacilli bacterium]
MLRENVIYVRSSNQKTIFCTKLYKMFIENKYSDYNKFIGSVTAIFGRKVKVSDIKESIEHVRKYISESKAKEMDLIYSYQIAQRLNDKVNMEKCKEELENISARRKNRDYMINSKRNVKNGIYSLENILKELRIVIDEGESYKILYKQGKIADSLLLTHIRDYLNKIPSEDYVNFLISNYNLDVIKENEINLFIEVLKLYKIKILNKINTLDDIYPNDKEGLEQIKNVEVAGEESLHEIYLNSASKLKKWKIEKLRGLYDIFGKLLEQITKSKEYCPFVFIDVLSPSEKKNLINFSPILYQFYQKICKATEQYNQLDNIKTTSITKINEIKDIYIKKLFLSNND